MKQDQAAALRQLKKVIDGSLTADTATDKDGFLATIKRPAHFSSIALIIPGQSGMNIPPLQNWFLGMINGNRKACVLDQGGLLAAGTTLLGDGESGMPILQQIETASGPFLVIPRYAQFQEILFHEDADKFRFIRHLAGSLGSISELWITIQSENLHRCQALLHATDIACILVPDHPESVLRSYEAVKSIHLSGYFSPIGLLNFTSEINSTCESIADRIKSVAKHFLSLDLVTAGMVLSGNTFFPPDSQTELRTRIDNLESNSRDFVYFFAERLLYPMPMDLTKK